MAFVVLVLVSGGGCLVCDVENVVEWCCCVVLVSVVLVLVFAKQSSNITNTPTGALISCAGNHVVVFIVRLQ
jgi:uncharacterized membrane protein YkvI